MSRSVGRLVADGNSRIQVGDIHNYSRPNTDDLNNKYLAKLRSTDPRDDKVRIEGLKGGLLADSYRWVLKTPEFIRWRDDPQSRILWIRGDPGKGKTMLLCGIINELEPSTKLRNQTQDYLLSYFFCQVTNSGLNNMVAVLRGLIYLLAVQNPSLISSLRNENPDLDHWNTRVSLTRIFCGMLEDPALQHCYLVIDALDECSEGLDHLLGIIVTDTPSQPATYRVLLLLELNEQSVSEAVKIYINHKVDQVGDRKHCDDGVKSHMYDFLVSRAHGTFLWVALVCQELMKTRPRKLLECLQKYPAGLEPLYGRIMDEIDDPDSKQILSVMLTVYRPITLPELLSIGDISGGAKYLREMISDCGSFLTVRNDTIYFVHQSTKDFLLAKCVNELFPSGTGKEHEVLAMRSIKAMDVLQYDIYGLIDPAVHIEDASIACPVPNPLAGLCYSCVHWVDHLSDMEVEVDLDGCLRDEGVVHDFLKRKLLFWLEALSLISNLPAAGTAVGKLRQLINSRLQAAVNVLALVRDAQRFMQNLGVIIRDYPLQIYASGLTFSPTQSLLRQQFQDYGPPWIEEKPVVNSHWSPCLQVVETGNLSSEGHPMEVLTFSPSSQRLVALDLAGNVVIWDAKDGISQRISPDLGDPFEHPRIPHRPMALSSDGQWLASVSSDGALGVWDLDKNTLSWQAPIGIDDGPCPGYIAFSPDGHYLAVVSDFDMQVWDAQAGTLLHTYRQVKLEMAKSVFFSPDGQRVAVCCRSALSVDISTLHVFDLEANSHYSYTIPRQDVGRLATFSPTSSELVWGSWSGKVWLWNPRQQKTTEWHALSHQGCSNYRSPFVLSSDDHRAALAFNSRAVLYDAQTDSRVEFEVDSRANGITRIALSPDGQLLAARCRSGALRIWDVGEALRQPPPKQQENEAIRYLACSEDGNCLVAASQQVATRCWHADTGFRPVPFEHRLPQWPELYDIVAQSADAEKLALVDVHGNLLFWKRNEGTLPLELPEHLSCSSAEALETVFISPDGLHIILESNYQGGKVNDSEQPEA